MVEKKYRRFLKFIGQYIASSFKLDGEFHTGKLPFFQKKTGVKSESLKMLHANFHFMIHGKLWSRVVDPKINKNTWIYTESTSIWLQ